MFLALSAFSPSLVAALGDRYGPRGWTPFDALLYQNAAEAIGWIVSAACGARATFTPHALRANEPCLSDECARRSSGEALWRFDCDGRCSRPLGAVLPHVPPERRADADADTARRAAIVRAGTSCNCAAPWERAYDSALVADARARTRWNGGVVYISEAPFPITAAQLRARQATLAALGPWSSP